MSSEINWQRVGYESRVDALAEELPAFVAAVLATIDEPAARASAARWAVVCRYFAGCAAAARAQGATTGGGGRRMAARLAAMFPCEAEGAHAGFEEMMDWLSDPAGFRPVALRGMVEKVG